MSPARRCLFVVAMIIGTASFASGGEEEPSGIVWKEGEDVTEATAPTYAVKIVGEKSSASGQKALFGTAINVPGYTVRYDLTVPAAVPGARLVFRYGRQHWKEGMEPARIAVELASGDKKIKGQSVFGPTGGWGTNPTEWGLATLDGLGDLPAGKWSVRLTSDSNQSDITLDGFFVAPKSFALEANELSTFLRVAISGDGYVGLRLTSQAIDQKSAKQLLVVARRFEGAPEGIEASLIKPGEKPIDLTTGPPEKEGISESQRFSFALPTGTADGEYNLRIVAGRSAQALDVPVVLVGELLAGLDARIARIAGSAAKASNLGAEANTLDPEFEHIVAFLKAKADELRHFTAVPDLEAMRWVAAVKTYPKDPFTKAANAARAAAQADETIARLNRHEAPYVERTGDLRRVYPSNSLGAPVVCRVYVPSGYAKAEKVPFVLLLHGSGGDADSMPDGDGGKAVFGEAEKRGYLMVSPSWPNTRSRDGNLITDMLLELISTVRSEYPKIDPGRMYATGASAGGWAATALAAEHPDLLAAICGAIGPGNILWTERVRIPCLFIQGSADDIVKPEYTAKIVARMMELRLPIELKMIPGCGHEYCSEEFIRMTLDFFDRHARKDRP